MANRHDPTAKKPFIEHVHELQKRLTWSVLALAIGGAVAYNFYQPLLDLVQRPLGQTLYYTSPTGGFSFLFKICLAAGFVLALPVILYHVFGFLGPLLRRRQRASIVAYTMWSINLAYAGVLFAYFVSLPAALHFLAKFGGAGVQSLITVDEYFNFALAYLAGFALLFQLPLVILFFNKIKPLKPAKMMGAQRFVILISFIVAAILTPTPDPFNQLLMAAPAIILYQVGIVMVLLVNRKRRGRKSRQQVVKQIERPVFPSAAKSEPRVVTSSPKVQVVNPAPGQMRRTSRKFIDIIPPPQTKPRTLSFEMSETES